MPNKRDGREEHFLHFLRAGTNPQLSSSAFLSCHPDPSHSPIQAICYRDAILRKANGLQNRAQGAVTALLARHYSDSIVSSGAWRSADPRLDLHQKPAESEDVCPQAG